MLSGDGWVGCLFYKQGLAAMAWAMVADGCGPQPVGTETHACEGDQLMTMRGQSQSCPAASSIHDELGTSNQQKSQK